MRALIYMVRNNELTLYGRLHGEELEAIPASHFDTYSLTSMPSIGSGLMIFKTIKGTDFLAVLASEGGYDRIHVPRNALQSMPALLGYMKQLDGQEVIERVRSDDATG